VNYATFDKPQQIYCAVEPFFWTPLEPNSSKLRRTPFTGIDSTIFYILTEIAS
jgi:hypothetical protein